MSRLIQNKGVCAFAVVVVVFLLAGGVASCSSQSGQHVSTPKLQVSGSKTASSQGYAPILAAIDAMTQEEKRQFVIENFSMAPSEYASCGIIVAYKKDLTLETINTLRAADHMPPISRKVFDPPLEQRTEIEKYELENSDYSSVTEAILASIGGILIKEFYHGKLNFAILNYGSFDVRNEAALAIMDEYPHSVLIVEPDVRFELAAYDPGDDYFIDSNGECWFGKRAGIEELWGSVDDVQYHGMSTYVAVIDQGFLKFHYEFDNGDGSYQWELIGIDDNPGIDYDLADPDDKDPEWEPGDGTHGTRVMGLINARAGNTGIAGVAFRAKTLPFRVNYDDDNYLEPENWPFQANQALIQIQELVDVYGVSTLYSLNMSFGLSRETCMAVMQEQLQKLAEDYGVVPVAAAANWATSNPYYPAAWPFVISVGGTKFEYDAEKRWRYGWSNYGSWVDIAAAAKDVKSTSSAPEGFWVSSGTSFASPIIAAAAAIIKNFHPDYGVDEVRELLQKTSDRLDWGVESAAGEEEVFVPNFARLRAALEQGIIAENIATYYMLPTCVIPEGGVDVVGRMSLATNPVTELPAVAVVLRLGSEDPAYRLVFVEVTDSGSTREVIIEDTSEIPWMTGIHGWTSLAFDLDGTALIAYSYSLVALDSVWRVVRVPYGTNDVIEDLEPQFGFAQGIVLRGNERVVAFRDFWSDPPPEPEEINGRLAFWEPPDPMSVIPRPSVYWEATCDEEQATIMLNSLNGNILLLSQIGFTWHDHWSELSGWAAFCVYELVDGEWAMSYYWPGQAVLFNGTNGSPSLVFAYLPPYNPAWPLLISTMFQTTLGVDGWDPLVVVEDNIPRSAFDRYQRFFSSGDSCDAFPQPMFAWGRNDSGMESDPTKVVISFLGQVRAIVAMTNNLYVGKLGPVAVAYPHSADSYMYVAYYVPGYRTDSEETPVIQVQDIRFLEVTGLP